MNRSKKLSLVLGLLGFVSIVASIVLLQFAPVVAQDSGPQVPWPADFRYWFHVGSKSIRPEGAEAAGLPSAIFGNTMDAVYANTVALNDLRTGNRPFRDGATFVAPFYALNPLADGGVDVFGDLAFTAVMVKDSTAFASTGGWGFEAFAPDGTRLVDLRQACVDCHTANAAGNDLVFSTLSERAIDAVPASDNGVFLPPDYRSMFHIGTKFIRPAGAEAIGLPVEIFGNTTSDVYADRVALGALRSGTRPFPAGSLFVADFHSLVTAAPGLDAFGNLAFTAVMIKAGAGQGDDPSTGDWRFEAFGPDGTALSDLRGACISCHASQSANDFVFTTGSGEPGTASTAPAATEEAASTGAACTVTPAGGDVIVRSAPGTDAVQQGTLAVGASASVDGQTIGADGQVWYHLVSEANSWVRNDVVNTSGDCSIVPTIQQ
jgi:mono/diheme cytochrome c family protein